jgi:mycofactocin precursor
MEDPRNLETVPENAEEEPEVLEEIAVEELAIDGICGVY